MPNYLRKGRVVCKNLSAPSKEKYRRILKMKKVLSFVLVLTLVLGSFSMVFAAEGDSTTDGAVTAPEQTTTDSAVTEPAPTEPAKTDSSLSATQLTDIDGTANEDAIIANCDLGIITGYEDKTFKPDQAVNRAEFAAMITRMLGVPESALAGYSKTSFNDMSGYGWANSYVGFCEAKGIVNGRGNGAFAPGATITVNEAVTMVLRAAGYTNNSAELVGNWPSNYVTLGKRLGIYDDVSSDTVINRGNAAQVIYNTLTIKVVAVDADGKTTDAYVEDSVAKTVIEVYLDCEATDWMVYEKTDADTSVVNTMKYIGAYLKAFRNDDGDVIAIGDVVSTFLTGDYTKADEEFEANGVTYTMKTTDQTYDNDNDKTDTDLIPVGMINSVTTPGAVVTAGGIVTDGAYTLAVNVSGKTIKEVYSVNQWVAEEAFLYADDMLDGTKLNGYQFTEDDDDNIDVDSFALYGATDVTKIAKDSVVDIYLDKPGNSKNGEIVKVAVGTKTVEGKITVVDDGDYTIAKTTYTAADNFSDDKDKLDDDSLGETGTAYLNYDGKIALWAVDDADSDNYAIVTDTVVTSGRDSMLKLIDKNGEEKDYVLTSDVKKDAGDTDSEFTSASKTSVGALAIGDLVTFSLDKNGKISSIDHLAWNVSNQTEKLNKNRTLLGNTKLDNGVIVFSYDDANIADAGFATLALADAEADKDLVGTYAYQDGSSIAVLLIQDKYTGAESIYAVLNSVKSSYNEADDKAFLVEGLAAGKDYTAYTGDRDLTVLKNFTLDSATAGVFKLTVDASGMITDAEQTTGEEFTKVASAPAVGYVVDKDGNYLIKVDTDPDHNTTASATTAGATWFTIDPNAVVYEYSTADAEYSVAKLGDIKKQKNSIDPSKVYLYQMDDDSEVVDFIIVVND